MKTKKLKIIVAEPMSDDADASYLPLENKIVYRKELDKFPKVKKMVICHELKHSENPFDYLHHLNIDIIDGWKMLFNRDYYKYTEYIFKKEKAKLSYYENNKPLLVLCGVTYHFIMEIYLGLLMIIRIPIKIYFKRTR